MLKIGTLSYESAVKAARELVEKERADALAEAAGPEATGKDRRTIERASARGEALGQDLQEIVGTSLDGLGGGEDAALRVTTQILVFPWLSVSPESWRAAKSATAAYTAAGYKPDRNNASKLRQRHDISRRINELLADRDEMARKATEKAAEKLSIANSYCLRRPFERLTGMGRLRIAMFRRR